MSEHCVYAFTLTANFLKLYVHLKTMSVVCML